MQSNVTIKDVSWPQFGWVTVYIIHHTDRHELGQPTGWVGLSLARKLMFCIHTLLYLLERPIS